MDATGLEASPDRPRRYRRRGGMRSWVVNNSDPVFLADEERFHYWPSSLGIGGARPDTRTARRLHRQVGHVRGARPPVRKAPNAYSDPIHALFVLDCVAQVDPRTAFSSAELVRFLDKHYSTVAWDSRTVGRILAQLAAAGYEAMVSDEIEGVPPIQVTRIHGRVTYTVTNFPRGRIWMINALERLGALVAEDLARGGEPMDPYDGLDELPFSR